MILRKRIDLPDWASVRLVEWMNDPALRKEAVLVADKQTARSRGSRDRAEVVEAFCKGWALERVVAQWLIELGYAVEFAPADEKWYDLIVDGTKVDVKGNWSSYASFTQTPWERERLESNGDFVTYLCFEIDRNADHFIIFQGSALNTKMRPGARPTGSGYVFTSELENFKP